MASTWVGALLHKSRQQGKSPFPYRAAFMINNPVRRALLKPARIVDKLGLAGREHVLELGPGAGFFSWRLPVGSPTANWSFSTSSRKCSRWPDGNSNGPAYPTSASPRDRQRRASIPGQHV
jgi:hypothetical protein